MALNGLKGSLILVVAGVKNMKTTVSIQSYISAGIRLYRRVAVLLRGKAAARCAFTADHLGEQRSLHFSQERTSPDCP